MKKTLTLVLALALVLSMMSFTATADEEIVEIELLSSNAFEGKVDGLELDNFVEQYVREAIGVDIKYTYTDDIVTTRNMRLMSGDIPDIFSVSNRNYLVEYAKEGYLLNLDNYPEQLADAFAFTAGNAASGKVEGVSYAIAGRPYGFRLAYWYNVNAFNAAGITEMPTTLEGFIDALRVVMAADTDGNGVDDTQGLSGYGWHTLCQLLGAYGCTIPNVLSLDKDGNVVDTMLTDEFYQAWCLCRDLWAEGIIDHEMFNLTYTQEKDKMATEATAACYMEWPSVKRVAHWADITAVDPDACWELVGPLTGPDGVTNYVGEYASQGYTSLYSLNAELEDDSKKLDAALKLINFFATDEGLTLTTYGLENTHWHYNEEGVPTVNDDDAINANQFSWIYQLCGREEMSYCRAKFGEYAYTYCEASHKQPYIDNVTSLLDDPEWYNGTDAETYISEECAKFLTGERELNETEWKNFIDTLESTYRYSEFIASVNEQWHTLVG